MQLFRLRLLRSDVEPFQVGSFPRIVTRRAPTTNVFHRTIDTPTVGTFDGGSLQQVLQDRPRIRDRAYLVCGRPRRNRVRVRGPLQPTFRGFGRFVLVVFGVYQNPMNKSCHPLILLRPKYKMVRLSFQGKGFVNTTLIGCQRKRNLGPIHHVRATSISM